MWCGAAEEPRSSTPAGTVTGPLNEYIPAGTYTVPPPFAVSSARWSAAALSSAFVERPKSVATTRRSDAGRGQAIGTCRTGSPLPSLTTMLESNLPLFTGGLPPKSHARNCTTVAKFVVMSELCAQRSKRVSYTARPTPFTRSTSRPVAQSVKTLSSITALDVPRFPCVNRQPVR